MVMLLMFSIEGGGGGGALGERLSEDSDKPAYKIYKQRKVLDIDEDTTIDSTGVVYSNLDGSCLRCRSRCQSCTIEIPSSIGVGVTFKTKHLWVSSLLPDLLPFYKYKQRGKFDSCHKLRVNEDCFRKW